jgi:hypothetical protein
MKRSVRVPLLGESAAGLGYLREFLESRGCGVCASAKSPAECAGTFGPCCFDLILDTLPSYAHPAILGGWGRRIAMCFVLTGWRTCRWLPVVRNGHECFGSPAMRPIEFGGCAGGAAEREGNAEGGSGNGVRKTGRKGPTAIASAPIRLVNQKFWNKAERPHPSEGEGWGLQTATSSQRNVS